MSGVAVADEIFEDLPPAQAPYALPRPSIEPQPNGGPRSSVTWSAQNPNFVVAGQRALCLFTDTGFEDDLYLPGVIESIHEGDGEEVEFVFFFESGDVQVADPSYLREVMVEKTSRKSRTGPAPPSPCMNITTKVAAPPSPPLPAPDSLCLKGTDAVHTYEKIRACHSLVTSVTFAPGAKRVGRMEAAYAKDLRVELKIPRTVTEVGEAAFCLTGITALDLGSSALQTIGCRAFAVCRSLTFVKLPATLHKVDSYSFANCTALKDFILVASFASKDVKWGISVFYNCFALHPDISAAGPLSLGRDTKAVLAAVAK